MFVVVLIVLCILGTVEYFCIYVVDITKRVSSPPSPRIRWCMNTILATVGTQLYFGIGICWGISFEGHKLIYMHVVINVPINGMPHLPILGARWGKGGDLPHFLLQRTYPLGHNSMSTPLPTPDYCPTSGENF